MSQSSRPSAKPASALPAGYGPLLADLKARVRAAQVRAALSVNRELIQLYWHLGFFPALAIALAVLGFAFMGDGLRDALDPRQT